MKSGIFIHHSCNLQIRRFLEMYPYSVESVELQMAMAPSSDTDLRCAPKEVPSSDVTAIVFEHEMFKWTDHELRKKTNKTQVGSENSKGSLSWMCDINQWISTAQLHTLKGQASTKTRRTPRALSCKAWGSKRQTPAYSCRAAPKVSLSSKLAFQEMMWRHKRHTNTPPFKPADSGVKNSWDHGQVWRAKHGIFPTASASCFGQISCTPVSHRFPRPFWSSNPRHLRAKKRSAHLHFLSQVNSRTEITSKKAVEIQQSERKSKRIVQLPRYPLIH